MPPCPPGPTAGEIDFGASFSFIFEAKQNPFGTACVGGLSQIADFTVTHLLISAVALALAILISVPIGLYLGHVNRGQFLASAISNFGRAVPALALIAFFVAFLGKSEVNVVVVLTLLGIPSLLTNTFVGIRQVDRDAVDAARGAGMTGLQIMRRVELPLAINTIFAGLRTSAVAIVATATIAPLANVATLGEPILDDQTYAIAGQLGAAIVVAVITLTVDAGLGLAQRALTPRGLRLETRTRVFRVPFLQRSTQPA